MNNPIRPGTQNTASIGGQGQASRAGDTADCGMADRQEVRSVFRPLIFHTPAREKTGAQAHAEPGAVSRHSLGAEYRVPGDRAGPLARDGASGAPPVAPGADVAGTEMDTGMAAKVRDGFDRTPADLYHIDSYSDPSLSHAPARGKIGATDRGPGS